MTLLLPSRFSSISSFLSFSSISFSSLTQIHSLLLKTGLHHNNFLISKFLNSFPNHVPKSYADSVFRQVSSPNSNLWNVLIKFYCKTSCPLSEAAELFKQMRRGTVPPDEFTFSLILKACAKEPVLRIGLGIHGLILRFGFQLDLFVGTGLIDMYGKFRKVNDALQVFDEMPVKNEVSWTAMIVGYVNVGDMRIARRLFDEMPKRNVATWNAVITGYAKLGEMDAAGRLFDEMAERDVVTFTAMIDGYGKNGDMKSARSVFDQLKMKDLVSWSALISGYVQNGQPDQAIEVFNEMQLRNVKPDEFVMVSLIAACAQLGCLDLAKWIDSYVATNTIEFRAQVVAGLVDMHAKCGNMERAIEFFQMMREGDLVTYSSLMHGMLIHGHERKTVELFAHMLKHGIKPDAAAFTIMLTACSRLGLVDEACMIFKCMKRDRGIGPSSDHYACMVDLLVRTGKLNEAYELVKTLPLEMHAGAWGSLLGACKVHCDVKLGEVVASHLFNIEPSNAGNYAVLASIYATANRWSTVSDVKSMMRDRGVRRVRGCSWM